MLDLYLAPRDLKGRRVCWELGEGADTRVDREMLEEVDSERPSEFELANSWRAENEDDEESDVWRRGMGAGGDARSLSSSIWNDGGESNMLGDRGEALGSLSTVEEDGELRLRGNEGAGRGCSPNLGVL